MTDRDLGWPRGEKWVLERTNSSTKSLHTHTGATGGSPRELWIPGGDFSVETLPGAKSHSGRGGEGARVTTHILRPPPAQSGALSGFLAPRPRGAAAEQAGGGGGGGRAGGRRGLAIPHLVRLSGGTGGIWQGAVPAEAKRDAGPQAQPSLGGGGAARATFGTRLRSLGARPRPEAHRSPPSCSQSRRRMLRWGSRGQAERSRARGARGQVRRLHPRGRVALRSWF
ncbi:translation initiation factor IF-2-like [Psammomys obesus]|uniref:translation initiation factor IF-2-like n=1 Tax=Psammomys obesus TaxID=48139 RepID=UPI0024535924|nr:translation initiation factor IF-2-like [Psammomys obesus]